VHLAVLRNLQGRYPEAEALYRKVAAGADPKAAAMALNNLAWLLALKDGKTAEALELVKRAMEQVGPEPGLLDTRAVVYLKMGQGDQAVKDLEAALADREMPSAYFHLAQAHQLAGNRFAAAVAWRKAAALGLTADGLDPLERAAYDQLAGAGLQ
jgi:tetratricopeptide (TPR) repeat protein